MNITKNKLDYELDMELRERLNNCTEKQLNNQLCLQLLSSTLGSELYIMGNVNLHYQIKDGLKDEYVNSKIAAK
jgi:hypothetical protein